ncbi:MAG: hypothetical protein ACK40A_14930, partial [Pannonibacter indicus]
MKLARNAFLATMLVSALALTSCNSLPSFGRQSKAELAAEERVGRLTMVLDEERVTPDPGLAGVVINLPPAKPVQAWTEAGGSPAKVVGHIDAASDLRVDWRRSAG